MNLDDLLEEFKDGNKKAIQPPATSLQRAVSDWDDDVTPPVKMTTSISGNAQNKQTSKPAVKAGQDDPWGDFSEPAPQ